MRVIVSVFSNLYTDQRVEKVCQTLVENGYDVELIGNDWAGNFPMERSYPFYLIPLKAKTLKLAYPEFQIKLYQELKKRAGKDCIILSNDLETIMPSYKVSKDLGIPMVFDSHEIFTEMPTITGRWVQHIWRWIERTYLPKMKHMITASDSYADWFVEAYNIKRPVVVRNLPKRQDITSDNSYGKKIILYQGWLNYSRGIDKAIIAMQYIDNAILKIAGGGPMEQDFKAIAQQYNVIDKVEFLGKLTPVELRKITPKADCGLSIEENKGLSYFYSLPNKISDYIQARVPVVVSKFPEMDNIVTTYGVGEMITDHNPKHLADQINKVLNNGKSFYENQLNNAANVLCWEEEELKLMSVFKKLK